jgi:hypothetical protein
MGIGGGWRRKSRWGKRGGGLRCTGITPNRRPAVTSKKIEVNCVKCNVTIDTVGEVDGEPVRVIGCPSCKTIFNRLTGEILGDNGA